ncbi:MAG: CrcB family protein, partial [Rhodococcus sp.]|nr:CrcB family protein [Rhodococcus sp. (in: high G+C Gram-positive bacteria)]
MPTSDGPDLPQDPDSPVEATTPTPLHLRPGAIAAVAVGGVFGTLVRYQVGVIFPTPEGHWPTPTFIMNILGAFLLGVLIESLVRAGDDSGWRQTARLGLGTGFLGAFTTYSAIAVDTNLLA